MARTVSGRAKPPLAHSVQQDYEGGLRPLYATVPSGQKPRFWRWELRWTRPHLAHQRFLPAFDLPSGVLAGRKRSCFLRTWEA